LLAAATNRCEPFATAILDLDHFKDVNDSAGHDAGDRLLTCVARALQSAIGTDEVIGRLGGDEFALILHFDGDLAQLNDKLATLVGVV
ncbi:GGDEF domain-containing protein, partial [Escherichia coli]|uniref:GGDEF domain-containing protein n=2 Tax=Pseudomonadota TaxID=1224 RepID=UPI003FA0EDA3